MAVRCSAVSPRRRDSRADGPPNVRIQDEITHDSSADRGEENRPRRHVLHELGLRVERWGHEIDGHLHGSVDHLRDEDEKDGEDEGQELELGDPQEEGDHDDGDRGEEVPSHVALGPRRVKDPLDGDVRSQTRLTVSSASAERPPLDL